MKTIALLQFVTAAFAALPAVGAPPPKKLNVVATTPDLTFYPSEFSKLRLQYNYDHGEWFGVDHSVWLQVEFLLGAHGAHKF